MVRRNRLVGAGLRFRGFHKNLNLVNIQPRGLTVEGICPVEVIEVDKIPPIKGACVAILGEFDADLPVCFQEVWPLQFTRYTLFGGLAVP